MRTFSAGEIKNLLEELLRRMQDQNLQAGIRIVGGAAIALSYGNRDATADIDAIFYPADEINSTVEQMAEEYSLPKDWLNENAAAYIPFEAEDKDWKLLASLGQSSIYVARPKLLLCMKLRANRGRRDSADIERLLRICKVTSVDEVQQIYEKYFSQEVLSEPAVARIEFFLEGKTNRG